MESCAFLFAGPPANQMIKNLSSQRQHGRRYTQDVVRFRDSQPARNPDALSSGEHQSRMRRDTKERSVVYAGIKSTHVQVPIVVGDNQHVRFHQRPLPPAKPV